MADLITQFPKSQTLAEAQPDLLANFTNINAIWGVDHEDLLSAHAGMHKKVTFTEGVNDVNLVANMVALFSNDIDGIAELIFQRFGGPEVPILDTNTVKPNLRSFCTRLPSGIIIKGAFFASPNVNFSSTITWSSLTDAGANDLPFTHQHWVQAFVYSGAQNVQADSNSVIYITDISNPLQFTFAGWTRNIFNLQHSAVGNYMCVIAIGD